MTIPCCNPKLGKGVLHVFANYYPERLGCAIIVNHKRIFESIWKGMRKFADPVTANKVVFMKNQTDINDGFNDYFDDETSAWLQAEIIANQEHPMRDQQLRFWQANKEHDPRGAPSFAREYLTGTPKDNFIPHPNIVSLATGKLAVDFDVNKGYTAKCKEKCSKKDLSSYEISVTGYPDSDEEQK